MSSRLFFGCGGEGAGPGFIHPGTSEIAFIVVQKLEVFQKLRAEQDWNISYERKKSSICCPPHFLNSFPFVLISHKPTEKVTSSVLFCIFFPSVLPFYKLGK